jgi:hypothetical protein
MFVPFLDVLRQEFEDSGTGGQLLVALLLWAHHFLGDVYFVDGVLCQAVLAEQMGARADGCSLIGRS